MNKAGELTLDPAKTYLAKAVSKNRKSFKFKGVKRVAPFLGDKVKKDNYACDENGISTCWPFEFDFHFDGDSIYGFNDNCGSAYLITEV